MRPLLLATAAFASLALPAPALAWGGEGHEAIALIARSYLTPDVRAKVDAILASDPDTLTAPNMASRATWADAWRGAGHRETASWHFVDIELAAPSLSSACFGFPAPANPASAGPAQDCVVDKVREFSAELALPATFQSERILALKYLLHFVGDLHQPLHSADNQDRGGNCVLLSLGGTRTVNLHAWWDTAVVGELGSDPATLADSAPREDHARAGRAMADRAMRAAERRRRSRSRARSPTALAGLRAATPARPRFRCLLATTRPRAPRPCFRSSARASGSRPCSTLPWRACQSRLPLPPPWAHRPRHRHRPQRPPIACLLR